MIGKTLNHFKVLDHRGKGGMGEVYVAEDVKLKRKVALKVFKPSAEEDSFLLFSTENKFEAGTAFTIGVRSEWGDGKPPKALAPQKLSELREQAKAWTKKRSRR